MREIKFRGKRIDNGEWIYGGLLYSGNYYFIVEYLLYKSDKNNCDIGINYRVLPETVGQFIGIQDKNNQDIYENDILKAPDGTYYRVFYHDTRAIFMIESLEDKKSKYIEPWDDWTLYVTTGNVFDNPELLKD